MTSKKASEMDATYSHWKRYKNRKKSLRTAFQRGSISADERKALVAEARQAYIAKTAELDTNTPWYAGNAWLKEHGYGTLPDQTAFRSGACSEECVGAKSHRCGCDCLGLNHGVAHDLPIEKVVVDGMSRLDRVKAGVLDVQFLGEKDFERLVGLDVATRR